MRIYKFVVRFRYKEDETLYDSKTFIITGSMLDLHDAWREVIQMALAECKKYNCYISSIYYSLF